MTLYHSTGIIAASGGARAKPGMVLLTPTSIAHSGTSASIGANGQVTFTAVTSLSLNGVFSAAYDNYVISMRTVASGDSRVDARLRLSGTDASGSNYTTQYIFAGSTTVDANRYTSETYFRAMHYSSATTRSGVNVMLYGPYLAQPTAHRTLSVYGDSSGTIDDRAGTHSLSTSYDGITFIPLTNNISGALQVYGVRS